MCRQVHPAGTSADRLCYERIGVSFAILPKLWPLEAPTETQTGINVETAAEAVTADFSLGLALGTTYTSLVSGVGSEHVGHAEVDFSTEVQTFVHVEVDAGGQIDVEAIAGAGVVPSPVIVVSLILVAGEVMDVANLTTCVEVDALVVVEVTLVAEVEDEATLVILDESLALLGVSHLFVVAAGKTEFHDESILGGEEPTSLQGSHIEALAIALERGELDFSAYSTCFGSKALFSVCTQSATQDSSCYKKLFHNLSVDISYTKLILHIGPAAALASSNESPNMQAPQSSGQPSQS